jgi:hypothetical protein
LTLNVASRRTTLKLLLADLSSPADTLALLRTLRAGQLHARIHPAHARRHDRRRSELAMVRAYEAGSNHHLIAAGTRGRWRSSGRATADLSWLIFRRKRPSMNLVRLAITRSPARSPCA